MKYSKKMFIKEGQALKLNDTQTVLEISNETNKGSIEKDLKIDFESFKTLYKGKIDDKCMADYNTIDDKALWEDTAKEMFLKSVEYIPEDTDKAKENLDKTVESKKCSNQTYVDIKTENAKYSKRTLIKESVSKDIPAIDNLNKSLVTKMLDIFDSK